MKKTGYIFSLFTALALAVLLVSGCSYSHDRHPLAPGFTQAYESDGSIIWGNIINFPVDLKTRFVLIKEVPALVCDQCGEFFIDDEIHIQIENIIKKVKKANVELEVVKFAA